MKNFTVHGNTLIRFGLDLMETVKTLDDLLDLLSSSRVVFMTGDNRHQVILFPDCTCPACEAMLANIIDEVNAGDAVIDTEWVNNKMSEINQLHSHYPTQGEA